MQNLRVKRFRTVSFFTILGTVRLSDKFGRSLAVVLYLLVSSSSAFAWPPGIPYPADYPPDGPSNGVSYYHNDGIGHSSYFNQMTGTFIEYEWEDAFQDSNENGVAHFYKLKLRKRWEKNLLLDPVTVAGYRAFEVTDTDLSSRSVVCSITRYKMLTVAGSLPEVDESLESGYKYAHVIGGGRGFDVWTLAKAFGPAPKLVESSYMSFAYSFVASDWACTRRFDRANWMAYHTVHNTNGPMSQPSAGSVAIVPQLTHPFPIASIFAESNVYALTLLAQTNLTGQNGSHIPTWLP